MTDGSLASSGLPRRAIEIVASVAQHRALSEQQVREIHMPGVRKRWGQRVMSRLGEAGLLDYAQTSGAPQRLWFATEEGVRRVMDAGALEVAPRLFRAAEVAGPLQAHTVAVNDSAIRFLLAAREHGDDFGPMSWDHEVPHLLSRAGRGRRRRTLFADALLTYLRLTKAEVVIEQRFLELDRATMSVHRLAAELGRYARLFRAKGDGDLPLWRSRYPSFPPVLCILAAEETVSRAALERRRDATIALLRSDPELMRTPKVKISIGLAEDLVEQGPFAPIFLRPEEAEPANWLGEPG